MTLNILYAGADADWPAYKDALAQTLAEIDIAGNVARDIAPEDADYIIWAPAGSVQDFTAYTRCKAVLNLWAGVERIVGNKTLTQPLCRMVDQGLEEGMVEWVTGHVLRHHLGMDANILGQNGAWRPRVPPLARDRRVTVLGMGALGGACARALAGLNFDVAGWSRRPKEIEGVTCLAGEDGLSQALERAEILVLLLPRTPDTENLLNAERLAMMPDGAFVINPGRGPLIDDEALLAALDSGKIAHATLDVFRIEPLPATHPYWTHPQVTVTPHIAADTRALSAARVLAENIRRGEAGEEFLYLVDRDTGY